jgi:excisionase family DNA binding protein
MEEKILNEFQELKNLTLLGVKKALTMNDASLLTGLSKSHLYKLVCFKKIPHYKSQGGKLTYFAKSELEAWQLQNRVKTADEVEQEAVAYCLTGKKGGCIMILTDYYKFVHLPGCKSSTRRDCTASTQTYNDFECLKNREGQLFIHFGDVPVQFGGDVHRKADKCLSKTKNISSVFVPDVSLNLAYGDVKGTMDGMLIIHNGDYTELEIFIARGQKNNRINLWQMLSGGELDNEISALRGRAVTELVTGKNE